MHKNCFFVFFVGLFTFQVTLQALPSEIALKQELKEQGYSQEFISNILSRILHEARSVMRPQRLSSRYVGWVCVHRNETFESFDQSITRQNAFCLREGDEFDRVALDIDIDGDDDEDDDGDQNSLASDVPRMRRQNAVSFEESERHRRVDHID